MSTGYVTTAELAERWRMGVNTLVIWRTQGIGPKFLKINNRVVYRECDIAEYEASCLRKSTSEKASVGGDQ